MRRAMLLLTLTACGNTPKEAPSDAPAPAVQPLPSDAGLRSVTEFAAIEDDAARSVALFEEAGKVFAHPRCVNCHPSGERPLQGDGLPHQPMSVRGGDGAGEVGMQCQTCHGEANFRNVPGSPSWHLAPAEMAWQGRSLSEICTQLKDPARNGGMTMDEVIEHVTHDPLVGYGWRPPPHLEPVPGNQALFGQLVAAWIGSGAHCPS